MRTLKLTLSYEEGVHKGTIRRTMCIPIPQDKEDEALDFEGLVASKAQEFSMSIVNSNVTVLTWEDGEEFPTEAMSMMNAAADNDLLVVTSPRLPDQYITVMVFCPPDIACSAPLL